MAGAVNKRQAARERPHAPQPQHPNGAGPPSPVSPPWRPHAYHPRCRVVRLNGERQAEDPGQLRHPSPPVQRRLVCVDKHLEDGRALADHNTQKWSTLHILPRLQVAA